MWQLNLLFFKKDSYFDRLNGQTLCLEEEISDEMIIKANTCIQYIERYQYGNPSFYEHINTKSSYIYKLPNDSVKVFYSEEDKDNIVIDISLELSTHTNDQIASMILEKLKKNHIYDIDMIDVLKEDGDDHNYKINTFSKKYINDYGDTVFGYAKFKNRVFDNISPQDILVITSKPFVKDGEIGVTARVFGKNIDINFLKLDEENLNKLELIFTRNTTYENSNAKRYLDSVTTSNIGSYTYALSMDDTIYLVEGENIFKDPITRKTLFVEFSRDKLNEYLYIKNVCITDIDKIKTYFNTIIGRI